MRRPLSTLAVIGLVVCISVLLAGVASTIALARKDGHLKANLSSALRADYSVDPQGIQLAPLSEEIVAAARRDAEDLSRGQENRNSPQIVPIFRVDDAQPAASANRPLRFRRRPPRLRRLRSARRRRLLPHRYP